MRTTIGAMVLAVCCGTLAPAVARADAQGMAVPVSVGAGSSAAASGFLLEGVLSASTTITPISGTDIGFGGLAGTLRAGWMLDSLAVALEIAYGSVTLSNDAGASSYDGTVTVGPLAKIFLWQTADRVARLYALAGVNFGAVLERDEAGGVSRDDETFAAVLDLEFGGCYFLHPNFTLGVEIGTKTTFIGIDNSLYLSSFFAALTIGFVAG